MFRGVEKGDGVVGSWEVEVVVLLGMGLAMTTMMAGRCGRCILVGSSMGCRSIGVWRCVRSNLFHTRSAQGWKT
jgi:hypothetical protein